MKISLLHPDVNQHLPSPGLEPVHYPRDGAREISQVEGSHFWFEARRRLVLKLLKRALSEQGTPPVGLDIGCGTGFTGAYLEAHGLKTLGVDAQTGTGHGLQTDIMQFDPVREFDFVCLLDVLEHIEDDASFLAQSLRFLKARGVAVIAVPAFPALWSRVDSLSGHFRRYSKRSLQTLITKAQPNTKIETSFYFFGSLLVPYLISRGKANTSASRGLKNLVAGELQPPRLVNTFFSSLLRTEEKLLPLGGLPFGTSLFAVVRVA